MTDNTLNSPSAAPDFLNFARTVAPFVSLDRFHSDYYRLLELFAKGKVRRLIVTMPPQHGKSFGSSVLLPAYMLGLNPDLKIAITSYSSTLANRFNKRVQRIIDSRAYERLFPQTTIKGAGHKAAEYVRTADRVEIIGYGGEIFSMGREGSLTGNRVDIFILDDLYKDAMEANSPTVRDNCWEWYTSVVKSRMHNASSELIVFTRWHEEDLIGRIMGKERVVELTSWSQIDDFPPSAWLHLNFEALKDSPPTEIDPRSMGEALWAEEHSRELLLQKRNLDQLSFECLYQGRPSNAEGLLYGAGFKTYNRLPDDIVRRANYTDTADTGNDYLCSICYAVDRAGTIYVTDAVYSHEGMEITEQAVARMIRSQLPCNVLIESNNGGRGFARNIARMVTEADVEWFHQSANKEARILSNASSVMRIIHMPRDWCQRWPDMATHLTTCRRLLRANAHDDAADTLTGIIERECTTTLNRKIKATGFGAIR